jgi:hypothetical protein
MQPRTKRLTWHKPVECAKRVKEALLHRVFSVFVGRYDRTRDTIGATLMRANERAKRVTLATLGSGYESPLLCLRKLFRCGRGVRCVILSGIATHRACTNRP